MKIKVLGTQSPFCKKGECGPSFLVESSTQKILLDCGSGAHSHLNLPEDLSNLTIILSHLHKDHICDIYPILYSSYILHKKGLLQSGPKIYLPHFPADAFKNIVCEKISFNEFFGINETLELKIDSFYISFLKVVHAPGYESYAIKIKENNKIVVYTGDIAFENLDRLAVFAKNCDALICESTLLEADTQNVCHISAKQAAQIAKAASAKQLILCHMWPLYNPLEYENEAKTIFKNVIAGYSGLEIEL